MTDESAIPETVADIDAAWLSMALRRNVDAVATTPLGEGVGFMGEILKLDVSCRDADPLTAVAKIPKLENRTSGELLGVYEREAMFFETVAPHIPARVPQALYNDFDRDAASEKQREILAAMNRLPLFVSRLATSLGKVIAARKKRRYILIIEYLAGMAPGDQLEGLTADRCIHVLEQIAPVHRKYWGDRSLEQHFWLLPLDIDARLRHGLFLQHVEQFARLHPNKFDHALEWLHPNAEQLNHQFVTSTPNTLLHGDLRLDNVMFGEQTCAFIDWQLVKQGPAAYDIAYFLSSALHAEEPDVDPILRAYHSALAIPDYTYMQLRQDYERALLVILSNLTTVDEVNVGDGRGTQVMQAWFDRLASQIAQIDLGAPHLQISS